MTSSVTADRWFAHSSPTSALGDLAALFDTVERDLRGAGLDRGDVVRNRLFAATRAGRDAASAMRFARLSGPARCASSSYIDAERFASSDGVRVETQAVAGAGAGKVVVEHDPRQPPCRFVAAGGRVFLSGLTSTRLDLGSQLDEIAARARDSLAVAATTLGMAVRPASALVYVHRSVGAAALSALAARLDLGDVPLRVERCDGYSRPGKLVEVEIDAVAGG